MVQASSAGKNIWVAASDGDLDRVRTLIETNGLSPNAKDSNSYTPMHAAASYSHLELLDYLLSQGGDIDLPDDDGDTPLFTVESVATAQRLVERGADVGWTNEEGLTAADVLEDEHPDVAAYLRSLSSGDAQPPVGNGVEVSELAVDQYANQQTSSLLHETQRIMEESERDGVDPDERLREVVERAVRDGFSYGGRIGEGDAVVDVDGEEAKRTRVNGNEPT